MVFTTRVEPPVAIATLPAGAEPHDAGELTELQLAVVAAFPQEIVPGIVVIVPSLPMFTAVAVVEPIESVPEVSVSRPRPLAARLRILLKISPFTESIAEGVLVPILILPPKVVNLLIVSTFIREIPLAFWIEKAVFELLLFWS